VGRMPTFKPDENGRPKYLPASYIMKRDPAARAAFQALRRRGMARAEAEQQIELAFHKAFCEMIIHKIDQENADWREGDRRPEVWLLLAEGMPVERIFPDLPKRHGTN
jgi:hypothetical protein